MNYLLSQSQNRNNVRKR